MIVTEQKINQLKGHYDSFFWNSETINNCVREKYIKTIRAYDNKCENEIKISELILKIPYYNTYFSPIVKYKSISSGIINEEYTENIELDGSILIQRKNINVLDFVSYFDKNINSNNSGADFLRLLINSYKELSKILLILRENKVCFMDLKYDKIVFDNNGFPMLDDFEEAIYYDDFKIMNSLIPSYYIWPLEIHIISFLANNDDCLTISKEDIENICKNYVVKNRALLIMDKNEIIKYYKKCVTYMMRFVNKPKMEIIMVLKNDGIKTWDNYSLSIMYLQLLMNIFGGEQGCNNKFKTFFSRHLINNLSPEPKERVGIEKNVEMIEALYNNVDWIELNKEVSGISKDIIMERIIDDVNHINKILMDY